MILGISNKVILSFFLFINFIQPSQSAEEHKTKKIHNKQSSRIIWTKIPNKLIKSNFSKSNINSFEDFPDNELVLKDEEKLLANIMENQKELVIQSDKQSEINNIIYAEGNVVATYRGKILKTDNLTYDKLNKKIVAKGNIV